MGSCITAVKVIPNDSQQPQKNLKKFGTEILKRPTLVEKNNVSQLVEQREKLITVAATLDQLKTKLETQGKALIKKHKRGRSLFALKRHRLYSNLIEDVQNQIDVLGKAILGSEESPSDPQQLFSDTLVLLGEIKDIIKLESPLHEKETLKEREEKFKPLFKKHHIQTTDVYHIFAQYEAEVNDITLTTSTVFKKSDSEAPTQPNSQNNLDEAATSQNNLDEGYQGSLIQVC